MPPHGPTHGPGGSDPAEAASVRWENIIGRPSQFPPTPHGWSHGPTGPDPIVGWTAEDVGALPASPFIPLRLRASPTWTESMGWVQSMGYHPPYLFFMDSSYLMAYDITTGSPSRVIAVPLASFGGGAEGVLAVSGRYLLLSGATGPRVIDIGRLQTPAIVGQADWGKTINEWRAVPPYIWVLVGTSEVALFDCSTPTSPQIYEAVIRPESGSFLQLMGVTRDLLAVMGSGPSGVRIYDVSSPLTPVQVGMIPVQGSGAYRHPWVAVYDAANRFFYLYDVSDPTAPVLVGQTALPAEVLTWDGHCVLTPSGFYFLFVYRTSDYYLGIGAVDISNPTAPEYVGYLPLNIATTRALHIIHVGNYIAVGGYSGQKQFWLIG